MLRPLPNLHRLLGLVLTTWPLGLALGSGRPDETRSSPSTPSPPHSHRGEEQREGGVEREPNSHERCWLLHAFQELKQELHRREARAPLPTVCYSV